MGRFSVNHRFTEDISGVGYISASSSEFTYAPDVKSDSSSLNNYGFGFTVSKKFSDIFSASSGYDYSYIDRALETYGRHVLNASVTGRF
jgi:outer membrane protein assembly factor BamA